MKKYGVFIAIIYIVIFAISVFAHSGGTDANGGHYDHSTGEYHYHHGHGPHQHTNGICPYKTKEKTTTSSIITSIKPTPTIDAHTPKPIVATPTPLPTKSDNGTSQIFIILLSGLLLVAVCVILCLISKIKQYQKLVTDLENAYNNLEAILKSKYDSLEIELQNKYSNLEKTYMKQQEKKIAEDIKLLEDILSDKKISCPTMAKVFADYEWYIANRISYYLNHKKHPARKAAEQVKYFGKRNRELKQRLKEVEYKLSYYENNNPLTK